MSKKIGMVAFRSSASGISVISNIGPTMPGIKQILFWPERKEGGVLFRPSLKKARAGRVTVNAYTIVYQKAGSRGTPYMYYCREVAHASSRTDHGIKDNHVDVQCSSLFTRLFTCIITSANGPLTETVRDGTEVCGILHL